MLKLELEFQSYPYSKDFEELIAKKCGIVSKEVEVKCGMWEERECVLIENYVAEKEYSCPAHSVEIVEINYTWKPSANPVIAHDNKVFCVTRAVLMAYNEGHCATTGICVDCLEEFMQKMHIMKVHL